MNNINLELLGEDLIVDELQKLIDQTDHSFLINIYGDAGSGKSTLLENLLQETMLNQRCERINASELSKEDSTLFHGDKILLLDDVDNILSRDRFIEILFQLYSKNANKQIIFTSKYRFILDTLPGINLYSFELGNRLFSYEAFIAFIRNYEFKKNADHPFSDIFLKNLFLFSTFSRNFNYVMELLELSHQLIMQNGRILPQEFINLLTKSSQFTKMNRDLIIDTRNLEISDYWFTIRIKDKIEKLTDLIMKNYPDEQVLYEVMIDPHNPSFVDKTFKMQIDYQDKVLNLCLSYDPIELLKKILGPRDINKELNELKLGEAIFATTIEDKIKLILKNIGLNILNKPKGLKYFQERFSDTYKLLKEDTNEILNNEYLVGLGISCYKEMEDFFREMLHFYAIYFCGSLSGYFQIYNSRSSKHIQASRITFGQYIELFVFFNKLTKEDNYQLKMHHLGQKEVVPQRIIEKISALSSNRGFFSHDQQINSAEIPYNTYHNKALSTYALAIETIELLVEYNVFPEIIKIKQIVFDEFGRYLFIGTDWEKAEIRFSLSNTQNVDIYSHYYIYRKKQRVSINPILIPRYLNNNTELFHNAEFYHKSSQTQFIQGEKLISLVKLQDHMKILDVGCGNGIITMELFNQNQTVFIDAFDKSESMIELARKNQNETSITEDQVRFNVMDALELEQKETYDLVFSNAALHWITESKTMYTKLYQCLKKQGKIAVHQGGHNSYWGLHQAVKDAIEILDLQMYYSNWSYPVYYPKKSELENLLLSIGFRHVKVDSIETDGKEYANLVENFMNAGMLPYINRLPNESLQKKLKNSYNQICTREKIDTYTHRLYATATKEVSL
jgi:trans-aconitate methyltransferase